MKPAFVWKNPLVGCLLFLLTAFPVAGRLDASEEDQKSTATAEEARAAPLGNELRGTLKKVHDTGALTIGYRESSIPFSYLNARGQPIGYSIDLGRAVVAAISNELGGTTVTVKFAPVTSATRIDAVVSGQIDLECGSTTNNLERQKLVAFSPIFFVAGTKLAVKRDSPVQSFRDLKNKTVVATAGTTNADVMRKLSDKFDLAINLVTAPDHAASFAEVLAGRADAFAGDDALLARASAIRFATASYFSAALRYTSSSESLRITDTLVGMSTTSSL